MLWQATKGRATNPTERSLASLRSAGADVDYVLTETGHLDNGVAMLSDLLALLYK